ncbi:ENR1 protein, partial [Pomatostomus ruficeps]|nr:ENR1 protein [Pomatostomus ruficeps]
SNGNPYASIDALKEFWDNPGKKDSMWKAPDELFWICGKRAYSKLPKNWKGTCTIGLIQPAFFLLPREKGAKLLGKPL